MRPGRLRLIAVLLALAVPFATAATARGEGEAAAAATTLPGDTVAAGPLAIVATVNGVAADPAPGPEFAAGTALAWAYDITNNGAGSLWALYVWHDGVGAADCPIRSLAPGEAVRCTAASTAASGPQTGAVTAWAWDDWGASVSAEAAASYTGVAAPVDPEPALALESLANGRDADRPPGLVVLPGARIAFRFRVQNTGNVTLWGLQVHDAVLGDIPCPTQVLAPGAQVDCVVRAAAEAGPHASTAVARAWDAAGTEVTDEDLLHYVAVPAEPAIGIEALVEGFDGDNPPGPRVRRPGRTIHFTYFVSNLGGTALTGIRVTDDALGAVSCPRADLPVGRMMICTATTVGRLGEFASAGRVTAAAGAQRVTASDPIYYHVREHQRIHRLALEVTVNGQDADTADQAPTVPAGSPVEFVYLVTYTGNNRVYRATVRDPAVPASLISCTGSTTLDRGDTLRCTATVPAAAGPYTSLVTVVSWDPDGRLVAASNEAHYYGMT